MGFVPAEVVLSRCPTCGERAWRYRARFIVRDAESASLSGYRLQCRSDHHWEIESQAQMVVSGPSPDEEPWIRVS